MKIKINSIHINYIKKTYESQSIKKLKAIFIKFLKDLTTKFENLYLLLYNREVLKIACCNLANNDDLSTGAITTENIDGTSLKYLENILLKLKTKFYKFSPFRRKFIPKPKKPNNSLDSPINYRPLGVAE